MASQVCRLDALVGSGCFSLTSLVLVDFCHDSEVLEKAACS